MQNATTRGLRWGARIVTLSWGQASNSRLGDVDRVYDDVVLNQWRTVTKSAGNTTPAAARCQAPLDGTITAPGGAYNVITVGGFDDHNTAVWSDDTVDECSSTINPISTHNDREKPDIAAPGQHQSLHPVPRISWMPGDCVSPHGSGASALLIARTAGSPRAQIFAPR
jgi:hypothetical protein